jgi:hypothetical protein
MEHVDIYCERIAPGLLSEPFNAATNAAIFIAAWWAWRDARRAGGPNREIWLLIMLMVAFGIGSTLFHTFANTFTRWLDILPIGAFIAAYLWVYLRRVVVASAATTWIGVVLFVLAAALARQFPGILNGSLIYAPALVLVVTLGVFHWGRALAERASLLASAGVFVAALFFRTVDTVMCAALPIGTHFMWHLLAAAALYLAMRALSANLQRPALTGKEPFQPARRAASPPRSAGTGA